MRFVNLAWRNTLRNPRRTLLTLVAFAIGVATLVFAWSVFDGSNKQMIDNMTGNYTGYIQIHRQGYTDDPSVDRAFRAADVAAAKLKQIPGVAAFSYRMEALALLGSATNSRGLLLVGVDPAMETSVTALHIKVTAGRYFKPGEQGGILLGRALAKVLDVTVGDEVSVFTQGTQGSIGAQRYRVQGLYDTQNEMVDSLQAFITLADAEQLLSSQGQMTTVAIKLSDRDLADYIVQQLHRTLGPQFEVEGWRQLLPEVSQSVSFHESVGYAVTFILFGIVIIGVANTVLMSIMERLREFGVLMAIGTSAAQLFRLIMYEGLILGALGFGIGFALAYGLVGYFGVHGLDFSNQAQAVQSMQGVTRTIHPYLSVDRMLFIASAVLVVIVVATVYPAWKIIRMVPLQAMRGPIPNDSGAVPEAQDDNAFSNRFMLLTMAQRNLTRQPMRSWLTLLAITFGLGAFVFLGGIANGFYAQIVENATGMITGDAQIQHKDFKDDMKASLTIPDAAPLINQLQHMPTVVGVSPRAQTTAVITSPVKSLPIMLDGVDPPQETQVTFLHKAVKEGRYLQQGHEREIVIGRKLAELLHVKVGERVVVMAQNVHGELASEAFTVVGMFYTGSHSFDDVIGHVNLPAMQRMLAMGDGVTNIAVRLRDKEEHVAPALRQIAGLVPPGDIRLLTWQELVPEAAQMNVIFKRSLSILLGIVLLMVSVVIMNTVLMSVMERTREFGTMLALGSPPGRIVRLVVLESGLVGLGGTLAGLALGVLLIFIHLGNGVDLKAHGAAIPGVTNIIFPKLAPAVLAVPGTLLPVLALLAALYPALRASRLEPVRAIRHG
jgi:ABC-type lipoprotein release transport system permease subunit